MPHIHHHYLTHIGATHIDPAKKQKATFVCQGLKSRQQMFKASVWQRQRCGAELSSVTEPRESRELKLTQAGRHHGEWHTDAEKQRHLMWPIWVTLLTQPPVLGTLHLMPLSGPYFLPGSSNCLFISYQQTWGRTALFQWLLEWQTLWDSVCERGA